MCSPSWRDPPTRLAWQPRTVYTSPVDHHDRDVALNREVAVERLDHRLNSPSSMIPLTPRPLLHSLVSLRESEAGYAVHKNKRNKHLRQTAACPLVRSMPAHRVTGGEIQHNESCGILGHVWTIGNCEMTTCGKLRHARSSASRPVGEGQGVRSVPFRRLAPDLLAIPRRRQPALRRITESPRKTLADHDWRSP